MSKTELKGELGRLIVHHNPNSIANVLSLKVMEEKHRITYDSWDWNGVFKVHTPNKVVEFKPSERGLHYVDMSIKGEITQHMFVTASTPEEEDNKEVENATEEYVMINTVCGNLKGYTRHEIKKAQQAR